MNVKELARLQIQMAKKVILRDGFSKLDRVAGVDVAYLGDKSYAAAVVLDFRDMSLLEVKNEIMKVSFPYIPGYLSFREADPMKAAVSALELDHDVLLVNGHGIAHPRGLGIAAHIGVELGIPTVGVAKGLLCGEVSSEGDKEILPVLYEGRTVGYRLLGSKNRRPVYVSPGNLVSLKSSLEIVKACMRRHALPEPLYLAHRSAAEAKKKTGPT